MISTSSSPAILSSALSWISCLTLLTVDVQLSHGFSLDLIFGNWYSTPICESTCQLSMTCWMSGGVTVPGLCSNYFQSCCYHNSSSRDGLPEIYATPRKMRDDWDDLVTNSVEVLHELHYGPVRNDPMCGLRQISRRRIVGGQAAGFGVYPWQAMIKNQNKSRYFQKKQKTIKYSSNQGSDHIFLLFGARNLQNSQKCFVAKK